MDIVDATTRSRMMSGIRSKDTKPEVALRRALHARGFRYRLQAPRLVGRPDMVFPKHRAIIFVHGCFWHRHHGCALATTPTTRAEFWQSKFAGNVRRDRFVTQELLLTGWRVGIAWECALKKPWLLEASADRLAEWLVAGSSRLEIGSGTDELM